MGAQPAELGHFGPRDPLVGVEIFEHAALGKGWVVAFGGGLAAGYAEALERLRGEMPEPGLGGCAALYDVSRGELVEGDGDIVT